MGDLQPIKTTLRYFPRLLMKMVTEWAKWEGMSMVKTRKLARIY